MSNFNRVKVSVSSGGTGNIVLGAADAGFATADGYAGRTGIAYVITWGASYECGEGALNADGVTFTRTYNLESSGDGNIPVGASFSITGLAHNSIVSNVGNNTPPNATGSGALSIGPGATASGNNSMSIRGDSGGTGSVAIAGYIDAEAAASIAIGGEAYNAKEICIGVFPDEFRRIHLRSRTTNATPVVAADIDFPTNIVIPAGQTWYIKTRVVGVAYNTSTLVETKAKVRNLSLLAGPTGVLVASTAADELNHSTFGGTASISVTSGGILQVTLTGIASTTVDWYIQHEIQRIPHGV